MPTMNTYVISIPPRLHYCQYTDISMENMDAIFLLIDSFRLWYGMFQCSRTIFFFLSVLRYAQVIEWGVIK